MVLRHPNKIELGDNVIIDDNVLLDAKGSEESGIFLGNEVFIGRNSILSCKGGKIYLDERANIGFNCEIFSSNNVAPVTEGAVKCYHTLFGHKSALTFASQLVENEMLKDPEDFGELIRGLQVYGYEVIQPTAIGTLYAKKG